MTTSWALVVLVLNSWNIVGSAATEEECENAFAELAQPYLKNQILPPDHKCVQSYTLEQQDWQQMRLAEIKEVVWETIAISIFTILAVPFLLLCIWVLFYGPFR